NERAYSDDFLIPGTYWSDPSKNCLPQTTAPDADSDGVPDNEDEYPADQNRAYNNYYPSAKTYGTLAFEDLWPVKGDFDFNDLVVNYRFNTVTNASNNVVEIIGKIVPRAAGTSLKNGFGFQLDGIPANKVVATSGNSISTQSVFNYAANGLEANQPFATCIVFDNFFKVMGHPGGLTGINTDKNTPFVKYDTITINMTFLQDGKPGAGGVVPISQLPSNIFNFFIVANQDRGKEIHLPDRAPTSLVKTALLGTESDDSNISSGKYYKTKNNLPWAINIISGFSYPIEKVSIDAAYLHFNEWVESGGTLFPKWYTNEAGNRVSSNIY
ncbi:MAG TPA: LruC domain-containing protein, partial [Prolixibacteraceae bacterium]